MQASVSSDGPSASSDSPPQLRLEVLDALMSAKGFQKPADQARAFGMNRTQWHDIRSGRTPNLTLTWALRIAAVAGTSVDALWGRS